MFPNMDYEFDIFYCHKQYFSWAVHFTCGSIPKSFTIQFCLPTKKESQKNKHKELSFEAKYGSCSSRYYMNNQIWDCMSSSSIINSTWNLSFNINILVRLVKQCMFLLLYSVYSTNTLVSLVVYALILTKY